MSDRNQETMERAKIGRAGEDRVGAGTTSGCGHQRSIVNEVEEQRGRNNAAEARKAVACIIDRRRMAFEIGVATVLERGRAFADALGMALGDISRDEAIDALKAELGEQLERFRSGLL